MERTSEATSNINHSSHPTLELSHERNQIFLFLRSQLGLQDDVEKFHHIFQRQKPAIMKVRWAFLNAPQRECLYRTIGRLGLDESLDLEIVHLLIHEKWPGVTARALRFAKEKRLASKLTFRRLVSLQSTRLQIELGCRREVEHVLHLGHMANLDAIENIHTLLDGMHFVAIKVGRALFELGEVLNGAQAAFGAMDLLVMNAA